MALPLLTTKLYIPPLRPNLVQRRRLIERLEEGLRLGQRLTLVSAPAGFGKTTLVSTWVQQAEPRMRVAWLSLDEGDNDAARFLAYLVGAIQTIHDGLGETALAMLESPQPPPIDLVLTAIINEIAETSKDPSTTDGTSASGRSFFLVLDDYHLIEAQPVHAALTFLLTHLPPQMHLVIITRSDPILLLSRLRGRGQVLDMRADDLRFSAQETTAFLNEVMGLGLSSDQVVALATRTEGWIAGLQLAALSMQRQEDAADFISAFSGDDRYVVDYLVDEVLARRPKGTKDFLLQTSILDRLTGPLCDAVRFGKAETPSSSAEHTLRLGSAESPSISGGEAHFKRGAHSKGGALTKHEDGRNVLWRLEQANMFVVPLDNRRQWYRYHHLFSDLLRQRLKESTSPRDISTLHRRASRWYEENDLLVDAVQHALVARDYDDAIRLIQVGAQEMLVGSQLSVLLKWWPQLPQELVAFRPKLCMTYAWAWVATGHPEEAERCLQTIEQALGAEMDELCSGSDPTQTLPPEVQAALVEVAVVRAELAIERGNVDRALQLCRLALPYLEGDEGPIFYNHPIDSRLIVSFVMGLAHIYRGELSAADNALSEAASLGQERRNVPVVAGSYGRQASVQALQGHLRRAVRTCQRGLQVVQEMAGRRLPMTSLIQAQLGTLQYEQNDLEAALSHLQESISLAKSWGLLEAFVPAYTGLAQVRVAQGDWGSAFAALDELAVLGQNNPQAVMPAVESQRAILWVAQGKVDSARRWAQVASLDLDGEIGFRREAELIILARVQMAEKRWDEATLLVCRLLDGAETGERWRSVIELLALQALLLDAQGKRDEALEPLARALTLAEPEGYVRIFVNEGQPMATLLRAAASRDVAPPYVARLLSAFAESAVDQRPKTKADRSSYVLRPSSPLVEPLSERELEVLRLMAAGLKYKEVAEELVISLNTVRYHTRNIYGKLGVNSRTRAIARATDLHLL